jgi:cytidine deaminase
VGTAIVNGEQVFKAIAIYSPNQDNCTPCGACRQVLHEFSENDDEFDIIVKIGDQLKIYKLSELLPEGFSL